jgi:hypothetical protein
MSDRKLSPIEVEGEKAARLLDKWFELADKLVSIGPMPVEAMQASAMLRRLSLRCARVERDLATERRLHRDTERRAELYKTERDVARRERDERGRA